MFILKLFILKFQFYFGACQIDILQNKTTLKFRKIFKIPTFSIKSKTFYKSVHSKLNTSYDLN